ncbi:MAG TPA: hypothetical protein VEL07_03345 [Planctomycetota bacterium]|nr:hypothetical protein [Planctomycetota bacterium]
MALFGVAAGMAMEFMIASRDLSSLGAVQDDVGIDANRILGEISQDLALSGWYVPAPDMAQGILPAGDTFALDRTRRYYPYIIQQSLGDSSREQGLADTVFAHMRREAALDVQPMLYGIDGLPADAATNFSGVDPDTIRPILASTAVLTASESATLATWSAERRAYQDSWYARSQEMIFLRQLTDNGWNADAAQQQRPVEMFGRLNEYESVLHPKAMAQDPHDVEWMSGWREVRDGSGQITSYVVRSEFDDSPADGRVDRDFGVVMRSGRFYIDFDGVIQFDRMWESLTAPNYAPPAAGTYTPPVAATQLREYLYAVIPSPNGFGRLVRAHKVAGAGPGIGREVGQRISSSGGFAMVINRVLSDNVVRVTFDTARTDPTLDVFEVRVRLYLARAQKSNPAIVIRRLVESIVLMRAKSSEADRAADLGAGVRFIGFDY